MRFVPDRRQLPRWWWMVAVMAGAGALTAALAVVDLARTGLVHGWWALGGAVVTLGINRVYVVVARHGHLLEGIDLAEAPLVAMLLALPCGEAVLAFGAASLLLELLLDRAGVKKVFNVGVRFAGAGVAAFPVALVRWQSESPTAVHLAVVAGALLYTALNIVAVGAVIRAVQGGTIREHVGGGVQVRGAAWGTAVAVGLASGYALAHAPLVLLGLLAPLALLALTARTATDAGRDARRLQLLLEASTRIQAAPNYAERESVLLEAAHELLLWRDVTIRDRPPTGAEYGAPLTGGEEGERWLIVTPRRTSDPWGKDDEHILGILASRASVALDRARLQAELVRQALLDPLTGVVNRRGLHARIDELSRDGTPYALLLLDLDEFKAVNDQLGHEAGDELLQVAARRLEGAVRHGDVVARVGGDEFVAVLPGVVSRVVADKIEREVAAKFAEPVSVGHWTLHRLPLSLGTALSPGDGSTFREVMRAADDAMYRAKSQRTGRVADLRDAPAVVELSADQRVARR